MGDRSLPEQSQVLLFPVHSGSATFVCLVAVICEKTQCAHKLRGGVNGYLAGFISQRLQVQVLSAPLKCLYYG